MFRNCSKLSIKTPQNLIFAADMGKVANFLGIITATNLVLVLGKGCPSNLSAVLQNVSLQFIGLSKCILNLHYFNTQIQPLFWKDVATFIIQNNLDNAWILDDDTSNLTASLDFENLNIIQTRGRCAVTIILNLLASDTVKRNVFLDSHPNIAIGTYTHSTLLLISFQFPIPVPLDSIRSVRSFFIRLILTEFITPTSPSFRRNQLNFETFYICPYCYPPFVFLVCVNLRQLSADFSTFKILWQPIAFESNYGIGTQLVRNCADPHVLHGYHCRIDIRRMATLTRILNVTTTAYVANTNIIWRYGDIQLRSFAISYPTFMLNGLQYQGEIGWVAPQSICVCGPD